MIEILKVQIQTRKISETRDWRKGEFEKWAQEKNWKREKITLDETEKNIKISTTDNDSIQ